MKVNTYSAEELGLDRIAMSESALHVVKTLKDHGYQAYLVGGCVRDGLMGMIPKDFDVATDAHPDQVTPLFKRSRIIGRRFPIVHVRNGREIIEVTTFRGESDVDAPVQEIAQTHGRRRQRIQIDKRVFGTIEEDVVRRDFTANALYFDPTTGTVLDYLDSVADIKAGKLCLIGDPKTRFVEDAVRMLRLLRFKSKLGFSIDAPLIDAVDEWSHLIYDISSARLFDEVVKFFHSGYAVASWQTLKDSPFMEILFPMTCEHLEGRESHQVEQLILETLTNTDQRVAMQKPVVPAFFMSVVFWHECKMRCEHTASRKTARGKKPVLDIFRIAESIFQEQSDIFAVPKRVYHQVAEIWQLQSALERRQPKAIFPLLEKRRFRAAYDFLCLRQSIGEVDATLTEWWTHIQTLDRKAQHELVQKLGGSGSDAYKKKRRRYRRPKRPQNGSAQSKDSTQ